MKIGFVLDDSLDSSDGVQQYVLALGGWLQKHGHQVHYLVGETKRTDIPHIHSLSRNVRVRFNGNRMTIPLPVAKQPLREFLATEQFDILHVQMPFSPFMAGRVIAAAPESTAIVGTFHIMPYGQLQYWGAKLLCWWSRRAISRLNRVWSVSQPAQAFAKELGIVSEVLPNVVDLSRFARAKPITTGKGAFKIVFLGRLVERKGCLQLLQALEQMVQSVDDIHVTICGTGPDQPMLEAYVKEHALSGYVTFTGYVAEAAKAGYLAGADIAVFPSLGGESFGIVLLEAMAAGAGVVVGGNNPGYASVLGSLPRTLVNPRDTTSFARRLKRLHDDKSLRSQLHRQQQELVKQYSLDVIGKKLVSYYQQVKRG